MIVELSMTSGERLALAIALFQRQGLDAMPRKSRHGDPHVLVVRGVEDAQEDLVRGLALSVDPEASPVVCFTRIMGGSGSEPDQTADEREAGLAAWEAALAKREAALSVREKALAERMGDADEILAAGDQRDVISDTRDEGAEAREHYLDRAQFLAHDGIDTYGEKNRPERRRAAARDRDHAKDDRAASRDDRIALTESLDELEADETADDQS